MRTTKLGLRIAVAVIAALTLAAMPAGASTDISIPFDKLVFGPPGSVRNVAEVQVEPELVGKTCELAIHAENQASVHPGNDLIVLTGTSEAVIVGVEDTPNGGTNQTYQMVLGSTITVQIRIGQDGMSSLGFGLSFDCTKPPAEGSPTNLGQQVAAGSTTTATPTTAAPQAATTAPPATAAPAAVAPAETQPETTTTAAQPNVAGAVANGLPETPAAQAVTGAPAYTG